MPNPRTPKMDARSVVARCRRVMDLYSDMNGVVLPIADIADIVLPIADVERLCELALAPKRETSDAVSKAAAKLMALKGGTFCWWATYAGLHHNVTSLVRSVAGSALSQDETPGKRAKKARKR